MTELRETTRDTCIPCGLFWCEDCAYDFGNGERGCCCGRLVESRDDEREDDDYVRELMDADVSPRRVP